MKEAFTKLCFFVVILSLISLSLAAQDVVSDLITPEVKRIILPDATGSLFFVIKTKPDTVINIEITIDKNLFVDIEKQTEDNFISDFLIVGKAPERSADEQVEKKFELPLEKMKALGQSKGQRYEIYYRALVLGPENEEGESDVTHWSLSDDEWEKAPFVEVFKTHDTALAWDCFLKGEEYFQQEEYEKAIKEYESAWFYYTEPVFIYNVGICHLRLAIQYFEEFLEEPGIKEEYRKKAEELVQRLRGKKSE